MEAEDKLIIKLYVKNFDTNSRREPFLLLRSMFSYTNWAKVKYICHEHKGVTTTLHSLSSQFISIISHIHNNSPLFLFYLTLIPNKCISKKKLFKIQHSDRIWIHDPLTENQTPYLHCYFNFTITPLTIYTTIEWIINLIP